MKNLTSIFIIAFILVIFSCKKDNPYDKFEGLWSGNYSGGDTGQWSATIDDDGNVSGSAISDSLPNFPLSLSGRITEDGEFNAEGAFFIEEPVVFNGMLNENSASGVWTNDLAGIKGAWKGSKR